MKILSAKTKILLGMIFTLMICLMFAGCSNSDTTSDSRGFTDFEHIEEEYLATIDSLNWPDGVELPKKLENENPERAEKALEELEKAFDMPYMGKDRCDDATRNYLRENIDKAKLGDPSGFRECIDVNY